MQKLIKSTSIDEFIKFQNIVCFCRPSYDSKLPLNGYSVALVGRLSKRASTFQKQIEQLGGVYATTIDKSVDVIISTQGCLSEN